MGEVQTYGYLLLPQMALRVHLTALPTTFELFRQIIDSFSTPRYEI